MFSTPCIIFALGWGPPSRSAIASQLDPRVPRFLLLENTGAANTDGGQCLPQPLFVAVDIPCIFTVFGHTAWFGLCLVGDVNYKGPRLSDMVDLWYFIME